MFTYLREAFEFYRETVQQALGVYRGADHQGVTVTDPIAPKPGPHLHHVGFASDPPAREYKRSFRDLAKLHALAAVDYMTAAENSDPGDERDELIALAHAAATVSLACSHIAPPARARSRATTPPPDSARPALDELRDHIDSTSPKEVS